MRVRGEKYNGKPCNTCGETLRYKSNYCCVACMNKHNRGHTTRQQQNARYKHRYGITVGDVDHMKEEAGHRCQICGGTKPLCVDHDHATGIIRGMLCRECNTALGLMKDNTELLRKAINYLGGP